MSGSATPEERSASPTLRRWIWPGVTLLLAGVAQTALYLTYSEDRTMLIMTTLFVWPATIFSLLLWWVFGSGFTWRSRLIGLGSLLFVCGLGASVATIEGFNGDMVPRLVWRWAPKAEAAARNVPVTPQEGAVATPVLTAGPGDWVQFRGPDRAGVATGVTIPLSWSETTPPQKLWGKPIGVGWSSFAVIGDRIFTQTQVEQEEQVLCLELATGNVLWKHADQTRFSEAMGGDGPRATPTFLEGKLYTLGATGILNSFDAATGKVLWSTNILKDADATNIPWAMAGSPLIEDGLIIVNPGGKEGHSIAAYRATDGQLTWSVGDYEASYTAPRVETIHGVRQVLVFHAAGLSGLDPKTGKEFWMFPWVNQPKVNACQPILLPDQSLFLSCGYSVGSARIELTPAEPSWQVKPIWKTNKFRLKFNDGILKDGYIYGLDENRLACLDIATGKIKWKGTPYGYGQILLTDNSILVSCENGELALVEPTPEKFVEITKFRVLPDATTWAHPVIAHGKLLVRNNQELACYQVETPPQ